MGFSQKKSARLADKVAFTRALKPYFRVKYRDLPWRRVVMPYKILVSEIMLQQTQVDRVQPKYISFLKRFPTVRVLARAPLSSVLKSWLGLGYNRRAKMLHEAAKSIVSEHAGIVPSSYTDLRALPGVGDYTAKAVRVFAFDEWETMVETNIRAVFLHHFFPKSRHVSDTQIVQYIELFRNRAPRAFYAALMDYGTDIKSTTEHATRRSAHYVRQKPFRGSDREIRGAIVRALAKQGHSRESLLALPFAKERLRRQIKKLIAEKLIELHRGRYRLPA